MSCRLAWSHRHEQSAHAPTVPAPAEGAPCLRIVLQGVDDGIEIRRCDARACYLAAFVPRRAVRDAEAIARLLAERERAILDNRLQAAAGW